MTHQIQAPRKRDYRHRVELHISTCINQYSCYICKKKIRAAQMFYDGGHGYRVHAEHFSKNDPATHYVVAPRKTGSQARVEKVTFDSTGEPTVTPVSDWMYYWDAADLKNKMAKGEAV